MSKTMIEWTDRVWNPVTGCSKVSQGCKNCYAERLWPRHHGKRHVVVPTPEIDNVPPDTIQPENGTGHWTRPRRFTDVRCHEERLSEPLNIRKPARIFVNSMSDLFHDQVPDGFIDQVFVAIALAPRHTFQILTKRANRMREYTTAPELYERILMAADIPRSKMPNLTGIGISDPSRFPLTNLWIGVSVEDRATAEERIPLLLQTPAAVRWISIEPMLGNIDLSKFLVFRRDKAGAKSFTPDISWIVVGGESGPDARPMHPDWVRSIRDQCSEAQVPFFFKQWGEWAPDCHCGKSEKRSACRTIPRPLPGKNGCMFRCGKKAAGRKIDGRTWDQFPENGK